jgi:putative FmdB family regulatory protein
MPYYDYKCPAEHRFIEERSMHETKPALCPTCKGEGVRLFVPPLVQFKGDGFYSNDKKTSIEFDM